MASFKGSSNIRVGQDGSNTQVLDAAMFYGIFTL